MGLTYSTTEQTVGTWVDNKPLYQITKVIDDIATAIPSANINSSNDWSHGIANIDQIVHYEAFSIKNNDATDGTYHKEIIQEGTSRSYVQTTVFLVNKVTRSIVRWRRAASATDEADVIYITIWYTKTTDTV